MEMYSITDFKNWESIASCLYRFPTARDVSYEIHITNWNLLTDIMSAEASLYIVRDWSTYGHSHFERKCISNNSTVSECLKAAEEDWRITND